MNVFKKAAAVVAITGLMVPVATFAETSVTASTTITANQQGLLDQLKALQAQIQTAQQQRQAVMGQLMVTLKQGDKGENVKLLQQLLASDSTLYPEGSVSGVFGPRTALAIKRFQKRHGLEQAGRVGPITLKKLNEIFGHMGSSTGGMMGSSTMGMRHEDGDDHDGRGHGNGDREAHPPCLAEGHMTAPGWMKNFGPGGDKEFKGNDHMMMPPCSATTTPPTTPADTTAPVISAVSSSGVATTTATVMWTTNENATGKVYFGTVNPLVLGSATANSTTTLSMSHSFAITGLSASTTYFYVVESKDAANNAATSGQGSFTTTN